MFKFSLLLLMISSSAFAKPIQVQKIEKDLKVSISSLQILVEKDVSTLFEGLSKVEKDKFELDIHRIKERVIKLHNRFATSGRFPTEKNK